MLIADSLLRCVHWPPCPGVFIAILAVLAAVAAFSEKPSHKAKGLWVFVFCALMCGEVFTMGIDREKSERDQQDARDRQLAGFQKVSDQQLAGFRQVNDEQLIGFRQVSDQQLVGFRQVGQGIKDAINESDRNFSATNLDLSSINSRVLQLYEIALKNALPPPGFVPPRAPNPPTGLVAAPDGDWGATARNLAREMSDFLAGEGDIPTPNPTENNVAFLVRSNAWYSNVMDQYRKQFSDHVQGIVSTLIEKGFLDKQVGDLAKNPVNVVGLKMLAMEIQGAGEKYDKIQKNDK